MLRDKEGKHTALGVLCDVSGMGDWMGPSYVYEEEGSSGVVPERLAKEIGISDEEQADVIQMEMGGLGFLEIAEKLEDQHACLQSS